VVDCLAGLVATVGKDLRGELKGLTKEIPAMYEEIESILNSDELGQALTYHEAMVSFLLQSNTPEGETFEAIKRIRRGEKQRASELNGGNGAGGNGGDEGSADISWNDGGEVQLDLPGEGGLDLDWGEGGGLDLDSGTGVDWDVAAAPATTTGEVNGGDAGISWDIEVDEAGVEAAVLEDPEEVTVCTEGE